MAISQIRNEQVKDATLTRAKLATDFVDAATWNLSSTNTAILAGLGAPTNPNEAVNKSYVDGLVDSSMKSPDGYDTVAAGDYPTDYKGSGAVNEGDTFYITSVANGTAVGSETVNVGDLLVALADAPGNTDSNWTIVESNRDQATETVKGIAQIATDAQIAAGIDDTTIVTPLKLASVAKTAGDGLTDTSGVFDVVAADLSLTVNADDMAVNIGTTNGTSLEVSATGLELAGTVTGARTFSAGAGNKITLDADADLSVLTSQPTGGDALAISTTKYVDDQIAAGTITASNGLTKTGNDIALGGALTADTSITGDKKLTFSDTSGNMVINFGTSTTDAVNEFNVNATVVNSTSYEDAHYYSGDYMEVSSGDYMEITADDYLTLESKADKNLTLKTTGINEAVLTNQPDGAVPLAIATTKYVDDAVSAVTDVFGETPAVTNGSADVSLANTPVTNTERIYLNGQRQNRGAANDYTISGTTVTFASNLVTTDVVVADYKY